MSLTSGETLPTAPPPPLERDLSLEATELRTDLSLEATELRREAPHRLVPELLFLLDLASSLAL